MKRLGAFAFIVLSLAGATAGNAAALPRLIATTPAGGALLDQAPRVVVITLPEHSNPLGDGISVKGPHRRDVPPGPVGVGRSWLTRAIDARQEGTYVVEWLAVASDSLPAHGVFFFSVGKSTAAALPGPGHVGRPLEVLG